MDTSSFLVRMMPYVRGSFYINWFGDRHRTVCSHTLVTTHNAVVSVVGHTTVLAESANQSRRWVTTGRSSTLITAVEHLWLD